MLHITPLFHALIHGWVRFLIFNRIVTVRFSKSSKIDEVPKKFMRGAEPHITPLFLFCGAAETAGLSTAATTAGPATATEDDEPGRLRQPTF